MPPSKKREGKRVLGDVLRREKRPHLSLLFEHGESHDHASPLKGERRRGLGSLLELKRRRELGPPGARKTVLAWTPLRPGEEA